VVLLPVMALSEMWQQTLPRIQDTLASRHLIEVQLNASQSGTEGTKASVRKEENVKKTCFSKNTLVFGLKTGKHGFRG
jgi:hypothetical protein